MIQARWGDDAKSSTVSRHPLPGRSRSHRITGAFSLSNAIRASSHVSVKSRCHRFRLHISASSLRSSSLVTSPITAMGPIDEQPAGDDDGQVELLFFLRKKSATLAKCELIPCRMITIGRPLAAGWVTDPSGMALLIKGPVAAEKINSMLQLKFFPHHLLPRLFYFCRRTVKKL